VPASSLCVSFTAKFLAIPHKERLATLHAICLQIFLQSLFRIFPHASVAQSLCGIAFSFHLFFTGTLQKKLYKTTKICYTVLNVLMIWNVKETLHVRPQSGMRFYVS